MRKNLYIPREVKDSISKHFTKSVKKAVDGFYSACEDEDTMTGHLCSLLKIGNQRVVVRQDELSGIWGWSIDYHKFRGRGPGATERLLGADGIIELRLNRNNRIETKSLMFQSKLNWETDPNLSSQCIKLSTWREASFVMNYTPNNFQAFFLDDVIKSKGNYSNKLKQISLDELLGKKFLDCNIGDTDLYYDAKVRKLIWRALSDEMVGTKFLIPKRLRVNIKAPKKYWEKDKKIDKEISNDEIHNYRMNVSHEDMLLFSSTEEELNSPSKIRKKLALIYHPDRNDTLNELDRILLRRMQEMNNAYDFIYKKKK